MGGKVNLNWKDDWNAKYGGQAVFIGNGVGENTKTKIKYNNNNYNNNNKNSTRQKMEGRNDSEMRTGVVGEQSGRDSVVCVFAREAEVRNLKSSYTPPLWHHS